MTQQEIIAMLRAREDAGAEALLQHYGPLMRYIIAPILENPQDREECLSEVTMRVWEKIELFDETRGSWTAWLTTLARNTALNRLRQQQRFDSAEIPPEHPSPEPTPEEMILKKEYQTALVHALNQLPARDRLLFYRKYYYLQSTAQIASELGMTQRAVEGKLYRIKQRLRRQLGGEFHDET